MYLADLHRERARSERLVDVMFRVAGFVRGGKEIEPTDEDTEVAEFDARLLRPLDYEKVKAAMIKAAAT